MFGLTFQTLLTRLVILVPILMVYGLSLCVFARLLGDKGPAQDGRQTLNPVAHLDLIGALAFLVTGLGWMMPMAMTPSRFKGGVWGMIAAILLASLALFALSWVALRLVLVAINMESLAGGAVIAQGLNALAFASVGFAIINLIPVLPLTGGAVLRAWAPGLATWLDRNRVVAGLAILAIILVGFPPYWLSRLTSLGVWLLT